MIAPRTCSAKDAFLLLWRRASRFDPERSSLGTWLLALVGYRSIDSLRRGAHRALIQLGTVKGRARLGLLKLRHAAERDRDRVPTPNPPRPIAGRGHRRERA